MNAAVVGAACILDRVVHQVRKDLVDYRKIQSHQVWDIDRPHVELHAGLLGALCQTGDQPIHDLAGCHDLASAGRAAALQPGEGQDVFDQMAEPVGLGTKRPVVSPLGILPCTIPRSSISV